MFTSILFLIIGLKIGAGSLYWVLLGVYATCNIVRVCARTVKALKTSSAEN